MTAQPAQKKNVNAHPLEELSELLKDDMMQVNAQILKYMQSSVPLIPQLASYLIAAGGKRIRPLLTLAITKAYDGDMMRAHGLAAAVEFIHTATLLHDDVVDESEQRRGQDSANLVFGNQASVLVGDFLFSRAFQLMVADGSLEILRILSNASAVIAEGEVLQLSAAGDIQTSMDTYTEIIKAKTAALFAAACEVGPVIAEASPEHIEAMASFGLNLGIAFQIADDALDYDAHQETLGKTVGDDFREGKMTAPVILAMAEADSVEKEFWARTMQNKEQRDHDLKTAQNILYRHDTITRSLKLAKEYGDKARQAIRSAPDTEERRFLENLIEYTVFREN